MDETESKQFFGRHVEAFRVFRFLGLERVVEITVLLKLGTGRVAETADLGKACLAPTATMTGVLDKLQKPRSLKDGEQAKEAFPALAEVIDRHGKCKPLVKRSHADPSDETADRRKIGAELTPAGQKAIEIAFDQSEGEHTPTAEGSETVGIDDLTADPADTPEPAGATAS